jgi:hypothetical protein
LRKNNSNLYAEVVSADSLDLAVVLAVAEEENPLLKCRKEQLQNDDSWFKR